MKKNYLKKITEIYAFVSKDEGAEGIVGMTMAVDGKDTFMPFVCADIERVHSLKPFAKEIADHCGKNVKLIKFSKREFIEEFECTSLKPN